MLTLALSSVASFQRPWVARTTSQRCKSPALLDVYVQPDTAKPNIGQDDFPDYMKSKNNLYPRKCDVMAEIESFVQAQIDNGLLLNQEKAWQPSDFLPDPANVSLCPSSVSF